MGTLLFDLLNEPEAADRQNVFDIPLLAHRLVHAQVGQMNGVQQAHTTVLEQMLFPALLTTTICCVVQESRQEWLMALQKPAASFVVE